MKRKDALALIKYAGYHGDSSAFYRLKIDHRISYPAARAAWQAGVQARTAGIKCNCRTCNPEKKSQ